MIDNKHLDSHTLMQFKPPTNQILIYYVKLGLLVFNGQWFSNSLVNTLFDSYILLKYTLKKISNWSPYIFTLV